MDRLTPVHSLFHRFIGEIVMLKGIMTFPILIRTFFKQLPMIVDFIVIEVPSAYSVIFGLLFLMIAQVVVPTYHLMVKFPIEHWVSEVRGDQAASRECYFNNIRD